MRSSNLSGPSASLRKKKKNLECQLIDAEGKVELENPHFAASRGKIDSG